MVSYLGDILACQISPQTSCSPQAPSGLFRSDERPAHGTPPRILSPAARDPWRPGGQRPLMRAQLGKSTGRCIWQLPVPRSSTLPRSSQASTSTRDASSSAPAPAPEKYLNLVSIPVRGIHPIHHLSFSLLLFSFFSIHSSFFPWHDGAGRRALHQPVLVILSCHHPSLLECPDCIYPPLEQDGVCLQRYRRGYHPRPPVAGGEPRKVGSQPAVVPRPMKDSVWLPTEPSSPHPDGKTGAWMRAWSRPTVHPCCTRNAPARRSTSPGRSSRRRPCTRRWTSATRRSVSACCRRRTCRSRRSSSASSWLRSPPVPRARGCAQRLMRLTLIAPRRAGWPRCVWTSPRRAPPSRRAAVLGLFWPARRQPVRDASRLLPWRSRRVQRRRACRLRGPTRTVSRRRERRSLHTSHSQVRRGSRRCSLSKPPCSRSTPGDTESSSRLSRPENPRRRARPTGRDLLPLPSFRCSLCPRSRRRKKPPRPPAPSLNLLRWRPGTGVSLRSFSRTYPGKRSPSRRRGRLRSCARHHRVPPTSHLSVPAPRTIVRRQIPLPSKALWCPLGHSIPTSTSSPVLRLVLGTAPLSRSRRTLRCWTTGSHSTWILRRLPRILRPAGTIDMTSFWIVRHYYVKLSPFLRCVSYLASVICPWAFPGAFPSSEDIFTVRIVEIPSTVCCLHSDGFVFLFDLRSRGSVGHIAWLYL